MVTSEPSKTGFLLCQVESCSKITVMLPHMEVPLPSPVMSLLFQLGRVETLSSEKHKNPNPHIKEFILLG